MVPMKQKGRVLALRAVKVTAAAADFVLPRHRGVVFLIYHRVGGGSGLEIDLSPATFERQMEFLAERRRAVTVDQALRALASSTPPAEDPVVVTFDDGTADFADHALPILDRHRVPTMLYVATDFVERQRPFPHDGRPLTWSALRDAVATGVVSVGSHTHTHAVLDRVDATDVDGELDRSIGLIGDRLGTEAAHFAYPKGVPGSAAADAAVRRRFRSAALGIIRSNRYGATDPYGLARTPIQSSDGMRWFTRKVAGGMTVEGTLRRAMNARRYADATT